MIENVKTLKENNYGLKNEKSKLEKAMKRMEKKSLKATKSPIETTKEVVHKNNLGSSVAAATSSSEPIFETSPSTRDIKPSDISTFTPSKSSSSDLENSSLELPGFVSATTKPDMSKPTQVNSTKPDRDHSFVRPTSKAEKVNIDQIMEDVNNNEKITEQEKSFLVAFRNILFEDQFP